MYIKIQHNTHNINNYKQTVVNTIFYLNNVSSSALARLSSISDKTFAAPDSTIRGKKFATIIVYHTRVIRFMAQPV